MVPDSSLSFVLIDGGFHLESEAVGWRRLSSGLVFELQHARSVDLPTSLAWDGLRLVDDVVQLLVVLQGLHLHLVLGRLSTRVVLLELLRLVLVRGLPGGVGIVVSVLLVVLLELGLLVVPPDFVEDSEVLKEVVLVPVQSEDLEDADHLVVPVLHQHVEEGHRRVLDHAEHGVLPQDLVLVLHDAVDVVVAFWVLLLRVLLIVEQLLLLLVLIVHIY